MAKWEEKAGGEAIKDVQKSHCVSSNVFLKVTNAVSKIEYLTIVSSPPWDQGGGIIFVSLAMQGGQLISFKSQVGDTFRGGK